MSEVQTNGDFIHWLGPDLSMKILSYLDDPSDLVRASTVSSSWHQFGKLLELNYFSFSVRIL